MVIISTEEHFYAAIDEVIWSGEEYIAVELVNGEKYFFAIEYSDPGLGGGYHLNPIKILHGDGCGIHFAYKDILTIRKLTDLEKTLYAV